MEAIAFCSGLNEEHRSAAAVLYLEAFSQKLGPFLGTRGIDLLAETFNLDRALTASRGTELLGLAGVHYGGRALVGIEWAHLRRNYGLLGGCWRAVGLSLFDRTPNRGELLMDGIVVAPQARGQGIGSELLKRVVELAREEGLTQIRLDVVDTNPRARSLYERWGFEPAKTERVPWLNRWLGFGASTTMTRRVSAK